MRLLQYAKPLTLIESGDWGCRVQFPETIHSVWRNGYGAGGVMEHASYLPFGIEYNDTAGFVAAAAAARHVPTAARDVAVAFAGGLGMRKPVRVEFNRSLHRDGLMRELDAVGRAAAEAAARISRGGKTSLGWRL